MKLSIKSFLTSCAIVAGMATTSAAQGKFVKAEDFGQKLGRAKKDHHIEANIMGGYALRHVGYSIAYSFIVNDGLGEVNIPVTYQVDGSLPKDNNGSAVFIGKGENTLASLAVKYRKFKDEIDEGLFYGGGLRIWHITGKYQRDINGTTTDFSDTFQAWNPLAEIGYTYKVSTEFGLVSSMELGGSFSTFPNPPNDPGRESVWSHTGVFMNVNLGAFWAF